MNASLWTLVVSALVAAAPVETKFAQVAPGFQESPSFRRSGGQQRAVVLIHGIKGYTVCLRLRCVSK